MAVLGLAVVAGLCGAVVWMYRHEGRVGATLRARMILAGLRCAVLVTLAVIVLEPVRVRILRRWIDSYTVVLLDSSSSMDLTDSYPKASDAARVRAALGVEAAEPIRRADLMDRLLRRGGRQFVRELAERNRLKIYAFSDEPVLQETVRATRESPVRRSRTATAEREALRDVPQVTTKVTATGPATNLDRAVRRAVESLGSAPLAAVVVLSDGGFNQGAAVEEVARYSRDRRFPIHAVGIGDPSSPRNVRIREVLAPENVFKDDPFAVTAQLAAEGLDGETVRVLFRERHAAGGGDGRVIDVKDVVIGPGGTAAPLTFQRRPERVGRFVYSVEVPVVESESLAEDNSKAVTVNVIESRTRVLIIAGAPSWDYRFVSRLLERDQSIDVSCWLQSADLSAVRDGDTVIDHLPALAEELFKYDVAIIMDPERSEFDEQWARLVDTLVTEHGGGLLVTAGRARTPALLREPSLRPLHAMLPVALDPEVDLVLNQIGHYQLRGAPVEIPPTAYGHPIMQLGDDPGSTKLAWQGIGDVYWHYPVLREKPAAVVLMRHGDPRMRNAYGGHVLAAVQFVGAGRTGFIGFDGTWRWRRHGEELFNRFWVQFVRYLAEGKLLSGTMPGMLLTEGDQFFLGDMVTVRARMFDERYRPLEQDEVAGEYEIDGERGSFALVARPDQPGWFEGRFIPDRTGAYRLRVRTVGAAAGGARELTREIRVSRPNLEILRPQMDRPSLELLAGQSDGGRYFDVDRMAELPAVIEDLHEEIPVRSAPTALWDRWTTLMWLVGLLSVEWTARKLNRLL